MSKEQALESFEAKIKELKAELKKTMTELISLKLGGTVAELLSQYGFVSGTAHISWDFYPEGDDEGGTDYWPEGISLEIDGIDIGMEGYEVERKSKYSDTIYDYCLSDDMQELICDLSGTLYEADVTSLTVNLNQEAEGK